VTSQASYAQHSVPAAAIDDEVADLGEVFLDRPEVGVSLTSQFGEFVYDRRELLPGLLPVPSHLLPESVDCLSSRVGLDLKCRDARVGMTG